MILRTFLKASCTTMRTRPSQRILPRQFCWKNKVQGWLEDTFYDEQQLKNKKLEVQKVEAIKRKEEEDKWNKMSEEEKQAMEDLIPEHRKGQLEISDVKIESKEGIREKIKKSLTEKYQSSEFYKKLKESDEFKESEEESEKLSETYNEVKDYGMDRLQQSNDQITNTVREVSGRMTQSGPNTLKIGFKFMRQRDPSFDINEFEDVAKIIFNDVYKMWKENDIEKLEHLCSSDGLNFFKTHARVCEENQLEHITKKYFQMESFGIFSCEVKKNLPIFTFFIQVYEIDCLVYSNDRENVFQGDKDHMVKTTYLMMIGPSTEANDYIFGHNYTLYGFRPAEKLLQVL